VAESSSVIVPSAGRKLRQSNAFGGIFTREVADHLHSRRFHIGVALCVLLFSLAASVRVLDLRSADQERMMFLQRWLPAVTEQMDRDEPIEVENTRAVSPLSVISVGLEAITPFRFTSTKEGLRFGTARGAQNTTDALFGAIDMTFVVGVVLSLLAVALSFDSVCGERLSGTLALVLSYPVRRSTFLSAKIAAISTVVVLCFTMAIAIALLIILAAGLPIVDAYHWAIFAACSAVYLVFFVTLGVSVSAWRRTPTDAALTALFLWTLLVFIIPRVIGLAVTLLYPPARAVEMTLREDEAVSRLRSEHVKRLQDAFVSYVNSGGDLAKRSADFVRLRNDANADFRNRRRKVVSRLWDEQDREEALRERYTRICSALSPTALYDEISTELAWTGFLQRQHFREEARNYDDRVGRRLAESREMYAAKTSRQSLATIVTHDDIRQFLVPFRPTYMASADIVISIVPASVMLLSFVLLAYALGFAALHALDVRA
jgi:ABC-type transport system involved in multi-copper enzyme maturation permease subunit